MYSFLTFDYELFFGSNAGSIQKCMIEPTEVLMSIAKKNKAKLILFIDAGYALALERFKAKFPKLEKEQSLLYNQIESLVKDDHDIQLHIHPHWEDTYYDGSKWVFDTERYKLSSFKQREVNDICKRYTNVLRQFSDNVFAYRAGGWCIQPFDKIREGLKRNNIWLDSTIYREGLNLSDNKGFDFRESPDKQYWRFEHDPIKEEKGGYFLEIPISSKSVSPLMYWKVAFNRLFPNKNHQPLGDGNSLSSGNSQTLKLLTKRSNQPIFLDGIKSSKLLNAYNFHLKSGYKFFTAIGHPKAMTPYSFKQLEQLTNTKGGKFISYSAIKQELNSL